MNETIIRTAVQRKRDKCFTIYQYMSNKKVSNNCFEEQATIKK